MAQYGKHELIRRLSDYLRKGWTNQQVKDLIDSLWRDPWSPRTSGFELEGGTDCGISAETSTVMIEDTPFYGISFQITPIGKKFAFYQFRNKLSYHKKFTAETLSFAASEGLFVVYYDRDEITKEQTLFYIKNPTHDDFAEMFQWVVPIMFIYYDATNHQIIYRGNNKHGSLWNPWIHFSWHQTFNSMRESGLEFTDLLADGDGSREEHAQFGVSAGTCFHEDIYATATARPAPADFPVWYFNEAGKPRIYDGSVNSLVVNGTLCYNEGGAVVPADDLNFVMYHIFYSNDLQQPFLSVMGQDQYDKVSTATLMIDSEVQQVKDLLPHQNLLHIGTLLYQTSSLFANSYHSRVVSQAFGVITDLSVTGDGSRTYPVILVNDEDEPGYNMYYGTDEFGIKGWHRMPREEDEGSGSGSGSGIDSGIPEGAATFLELTDTPDSYEGQAGKIPVVNQTEDGLVFEDMPDSAEQLQSDWTQADTGALDYIKNKPTIPDAGIDDVFVEQDPQYPLEYLKYSKGGVDYDVTTLAKPDGIIWGFNVNWIEGLQFGVTAGAAFKRGTLYTDDYESITLDAADPDDPRIDLIIFDIVSGITKITGTPAANPQEPSIDPETQFRITAVLVPAGATEPGIVITDLIIYDENTEYTGSVNGVTVDFDGTTQKFHGSKAADVGTIDNNDSIWFTKPDAGNVDITAYESISFDIFLKAVMSSQHNLYVGFYCDGRAASNEVLVPLNKSTISGWQGLVISLKDFVWAQSSIDQVYFRWKKSGTNTAHTGFYLDYIKLQSGVIQVIQPGVDEKVKYDVTDPTAGYLTPKLAGVDADTVADADTFNFVQVATGLLKKITWTNIKATLKTYFDGIYSTVTTFLGLTDTPSSYSGQGGKIVAVKSDATGLEFIAPPAAGATTFLSLTDTPAAYTGQAGKYPKVNAGENALEFDTPGAGDFATKALDNLESVAINTSLISDTDSTDDLGSSAKYWANLYVDTIYSPAINGGAAANDDITIQGTTHATRATSYIKLQPGGGYVGIGTSTPICLLDLGGHNTANSSLKIGGMELQSVSTDSAQINYNCYVNGGTFYYRANGYAGQFSVYLGAYWLDGAVSGTAGNPITWRDTMYLTGNWTKFGILNASPVCRLDLGAISTSNSLFKAGGIEIQSYATTDAWLADNCYYNGGYKFRANGWANFIHFYDGSISLYSSTASGAAGGALTWKCRFRMNQNGDLSIGGALGMATNSLTNAAMVVLNSNNRIGIGLTAPTAMLHIKAGTATANTAPLMFTSGTLLSSPEAGAFEFLTDNIHITISTGTARKGIVLDDGTRLTSGKIPIATTNGRLIDGQTPLAGTKVYYVADSSEGASTRKLTFIDGILVSET